MASVRAASARAMSAIAGGSPSAFPYVGAMYFEVDISGVHLGSWTRCSGLEIKFDNKIAVVRGELVAVPGRTTKIPELKLERPLTHKGSEAVQHLLRKHWHKPEKHEATVRLLNVHGEVVTKWELRGVLLKEWGAPKLETTSKNVATETLEFTYDGFVKGTDHTFASYFEVTIDGHDDLGRWTSCTGLGVQMKPEKVTSDGEKAAKPRTTKGPTFDDVTLKRPFSAKAWKSVEKLLVKQRDATTPTEHSATITLHAFDPEDKGAVRTTKWTLHKVVVASWKCSELDAEKALVPQETLLLSHGGFLKPEETAPRKRAKLTDGSQSIEFAGDPTVMKEKLEQSFTAWKRAVPGGGKPSSPGPSEFKGSEPLKLDVTVPLIKDSARDKSVAAQISILKGWAGQVVAGRHRAAADKPHAPRKLTFTWNEESCEGHITRLTISVDARDKAGAPSKATAMFEMQGDPSKPPGTNPTSGGVAGRRTRLIADGDTLQSVAYAEYGRASGWRALAAANGIDDPLRVAAGTRLLLPSDL